MAALSRLNIAHSLLCGSFRCLFVFFFSPLVSPLCRTWLSSLVFFGNTQAVLSCGGREAGWREGIEGVGQRLAKSDEREFGRRWLRKWEKRDTKGRGIRGGGQARLGGRESDSVEYVLQGEKRGRESGWGCYKRIKAGLWFVSHDPLTGCSLVRSRWQRHHRCSRWRQQKKGRARLCTKKT